MDAYLHAVMVIVMVIVFIRLDAMDLIHEAHLLSVKPVSVDGVLECGVEGSSDRVLQGGGL